MANKMPNDDFYENVEEMNEANAEKMVGATDKALKGIFQENMLPKDAMGLSDDVLEGIYGHAYNMYSTGKYDEASMLFRMLMLLNPLDSKFTLGLAACCHMMDNFEAAIGLYQMLFTLDPLNPIPHYHLADCYVQIEAMDGAQHELDTAIELCGKNKEYESIKDRSRMMLEKLKKGEGAELKKQKHAPVETPKKGGK